NGMELLREQDFSSRLSSVGQHEADKVVNVFNRMMDQLKNERLRLREQNHFLDLLINASPMGVVILSLDEELTQINPMAARFMGVLPEEVIGKKLTEVDSVLSVELSKIPRQGTVTVRLNDSSIYKCTHSSFIDRGFHHPFFLIEVLTDEVIKAEKKAYEKVIRMIAHEVNNTTAGITSTLDTLEQAFSTQEDNAELTEVLRVCIDRCFSMSHFITRFADVVKIPDPSFSPTDLNEILTSCVRFMQGMCNERNIQILSKFEKMPLLMVDGALFEQVLLNIIKNAAESIGQEGVITITTSGNGDIEIADNGKGISKEVEDKLFSPFFSTKPNGQGIGLILIREILTRHGCTFSLRTYHDGITRFRIHFSQ
ncbi:MAG TPA: ATP-binding protein, partial [Bacteroides graminisolvens]|nr:ATP-binding protein [Bacteroides graminisolvens]